MVSKRPEKAASGLPARASARPSPAEPETFVIREAAAADLDALVELAAHLDSVNLPNDRGVLKGLVSRSRASFAGKIEDPFRREYLFVMEQTSTGRIAGTSAIIAQHGHPDAPHVYFDVIRDERYSITLDRHFPHLCLRLGFNYRGPTEIGGLVLDPSLRAHGLGRQLSFVRFLFIAMYRPRFRSSVIAELMPPLLADGRSELWEHLGRHFTGLDYQEADKLSKTNKEFITALFPQTPLYATLLPEHVQKLIGQVGDQTRGVKRMLEGIGFRYSEQIDPFDGGPHFEALTDEISLVRTARPARVAKDPWPEEPPPPSDGEAPGLGSTRVLVAVGAPEGPSRFASVAGFARPSGEVIHLPERMSAALKAKPGQQVWWVGY